MEPFETLGIWWLPENEVEQLTGTLSFSPEEGVRLELVGSFADMMEALNTVNAHKYRIFPKIFGIIQNGDFVTLEDCTELNAGLAWGTLRRQTFQCRFGYLGSHHISVNKPMFTEILAEYSHLLDWLRMSGVFEEVERNPETGLSKFTLVYQEPQALKAHYENVEIAFGLNMSARYGARTKSYSEQSVCHIKLTEARSIDSWLQDYVGPLQDLLTLATDRPNAVLKLSAYPSEETDCTQEKVTDKPLKRYFQIIYTPLFYKSCDPDKWIFPEECNFVLNDLSASGIALANFLAAWFKFRKELSNVCDLYFNSRYRPAVFVEDRFLALVRASESYQRMRGRSTTILPKKEFKALKEQLKEQVVSIFSANYPQFVNKFVNKIDYLNEAKLYERIVELYELSEGIAEELYPEKEKFAKTVTDTRNYYTHPTPEDKDRKLIANSTEMQLFSNAFTYILGYCFMRNLGFSEEDCKRLLKRNGKFQITRLQIQSYYRDKREK